MDTEKVIELEKRLLTQEVRGDGKILGLLLMDNFIEFGSFGKVYSKSDILLRLPGENNRKIETYDFRSNQLSPDENKRYGLNGKS